MHIGGILVTRVHLLLLSWEIAATILIDTEVIASPHIRARVAQWIERLLPNTHGKRAAGRGFDPHLGCYC